MDSVTVLVLYTLGFAVLVGLPFAAIFLYQWLTTNSTEQNWKRNGDWTRWRML